MRGIRVATGAITVAVVGGDGVRALPAVEGAMLRRFPSSRDDGKGGRRIALAAIRAGGFALVLIQARWMGHRDSERLRRTCRNSGGPYRVVTGVMSTVWRVLHAFVARGASDVW